MSASADPVAAAHLLIRIEAGAFASRLLGSSSRRGARARVLAVLRWQRRIDAALAAHLHRPLNRLDPEVRAVLRVGLAEATVLRVPPAVAVDGAVRAIRRLGKASAAGMVNAVLRRALPTWERLGRDAAPDLALSHPAWLWNRWRANFGAGAARAAMAADQEPASVWVWWIDPAAANALGQRGAALEPHPWCEGAWRAPGADALLAAEAAAGRAYVQDPSSQLAALVAGAFWREGAWLADLCAAPGGKAALAARRTFGARVAASDLRPRRARLVASLLGRVTGRPRVLVQDALEPALCPGSWRVVLLDAPCSGTGTLRRHPELRWRLTEAAILERAALQTRLIRAALPLVERGGVLLYTTCSVEPEENEEHFRTIPEGFEPLDLAERFPAVPALRTPAGGLRLLPAPLWDGFTLHALRRQT